MKPPMTLFSLPFPMSFSWETQGKAERMGKSFLTLQKVTLQLMTHPKTEPLAAWMPESFMKSSTSPRAICKAVPNLHLSDTTVLWTKHGHAKHDPFGNEQNFPFASCNLTRIYKPLQMDVSILFHLWICANMLIHTVNFTVNAKFRISQPDTNS